MRVLLVFINLVLSSTTTIKIKDRAKIRGSTLYPIHPVSANEPTRQEQEELAKVDLQAILYPHDIEFKLTAVEITSLDTIYALYVTNEKRLLGEVHYVATFETDRDELEEEFKDVVLNHVKLQWKGASSLDNVFFIDTTYEEEYSHAAECWDGFNCTLDGPLLWIVFSSGLFLFFLIFLITMFCCPSKRVKNIITICIIFLYLGILATLLTLGFLDFFTWITLSPLITGNCLLIVVTPCIIILQ